MSLCLSIQTAGLARRPRAHDGHSGSLQGVRDRAGLEDWRASHHSTPCWVPRGSEKTLERMEQAVVKETLEATGYIPQDCILERNRERTVDGSVPLHPSLVVQLQAVRRRRNGDGVKTSFWRVQMFAEWWAWDLRCRLLFWCMCLLQCVKRWSLRESVISKSLCTRVFS